MQLSTYMRQHGLDEPEMARRVGVARSTLWRALKGRVTPNANTRAKIVGATDGLVTERDLLLGAVYAVTAEAV